MKNLKLIIALVTLTSLISCNDKRKPQVQYMPDMYESVPYDANGANGINGKPVNREPVAGTLVRGGYPSYDIADTPEGYEKAKAEVLNPLEASEVTLEKGKVMYEIYCSSCHGEKGDGNGVLSQREKFSGIPNYKDRDINAGSIYHVIMYGKNLMGSHASQLTYNERWQIVHYVEKLRTDLLVQ
ncbi:cytochrome c [uncultured Polaribacter sp.]|uniref:c-type cytochrome n=1 Tax=uncultured Polaribacter sp. TaxID=174711 RepID=UPI0030D910CA|tara:strand:+ start:224 stop:775 length:552 start_codon:yes stop_codon:yes gene_type:complete